jgi:hypothetical protein
MADEVKQPSQVGVVTPPARPRGPGPRRRPRQVPEQAPGGERRRRPQPDEVHHIDEYV